MNRKQYLTPAAYGEALLVEKKSRFIARVWPCATEKEAMEHIAKMREQYWDATHNVSAFIVCDGRVERCSDDGEPQGTSGLPTLSVFRNEELVNVCCVVTRYFGGTLLGAGGLVRAYSRAAKMALDEAGIDCMRQWNLLLLECPYPLFERVRNLIGSCGGSVTENEFGAEVLIQALVPVEETGKFELQLSELSSGSMEAVLMDTIYKGVRIR